MPAFPIHAIDARRYRLPLDPPLEAAWDPQPRAHLDATIVRVRAGDYEGVASGSDALAMQQAAPLFVGRDASDIDRHVEVLDNLQFHGGRCWALEVALWDLMGKARGEPLWRLLGGTDGRVRVYASTARRLPPQERAEFVRRLVREGFTAVKLRLDPDDQDWNVATVGAAREAAGRDVALLLDANQGWRMAGDTAPPWSLETALSVAERLAEHDVFWLEEPLHRHDYRGLAELRRRSPLRIAGGEGNREFAELREYLHHGSLDVYQPDVVWSTGVLRATRLAREVAEAGALYTPHTWGDGLVLLANLHVAASVSNAPFVEFPYDPPAWTPERRDFFLPQPIFASDGQVILPDAPGLGVEIDWDAIEAYRTG